MDRTARCCPNEDKSFMLHPCPKPSFIRFRGPHADALVLRGHSALCETWALNSHATSVCPLTLCRTSLCLATGVPGNRATSRQRRFLLERGAAEVCGSSLLQYSLCSPRKSSHNTVLPQ